MWRTNIPCSRLQQKPVTFNGVEKATATAQKPVYIRANRICTIPPIRERTVSTRHMRKISENHRRDLCDHRTTIRSKTKSSSGRLTSSPKLVQSMCHNVICIYIHYEKNTHHPTTNQDRNPRPSHHHPYQKVPRLTRLGTCAWWWARKIGSRRGRAMDATRKHPKNEGTTTNNFIHAQMAGQQTQA